MVDQLKLPLDRAAEMFVLMSVAQADAFIGCWRTKYQCNVLRPITYIRRHIDPTWEPFIVTPPFPEYTSGTLDPVVGGRDGADRAAGRPWRSTTAPTSPSVTPSGASQSFVAASDEAAISRLYGGHSLSHGDRERAGARAAASDAT